MTSPEGLGHLTTDELFRQHAGFVARFLSRLGVPPDQLDDALQEVFLVVHRNGGYRPGIAKPASYLGSIAVRAAAKHRRRDGLARQRHADATLDHLAGEHDDPARSLQTREDLERLQLALARLPEELCTTLLLVEMEGESCVSVAAGLGCPVGTIYWRLHQARKELRAALRAVDAPRRTPVAKPLEDNAQPARSWMILLGLDGFDRSEASRLLQLARAQPAPVALDAQLARHYELVRAGAELPAWASGVAMQPATWLGVLGTAPLALGVLASGVLVAGAVLALREAPQPPVQRAPSSGVTERVAAAPVQPIAPVAAAPAPPHAVALQAAQAEAPVRRARPPRPIEATGGDPASVELEADPALEALTTSPTDGHGTELDARPNDHPQPRTVGEAELEPRTVREPQPKPTAAVEPSQPPERAATDQQLRRALTDEELAEMRAIARAERLLSDDPKRALALTRAIAAGYPQSRFTEERSYLEVIALQRLARTGEMRDKATAFLDAYPTGLYSERVRRALAGRGE